MRHLPWGTVTGTVAVAGAVLVSVGLSGSAVADSGGGDPPGPDNGGSIVEDFSYPNASDVLAQDGVKLTSGDGHILYQRDCAHPPTGDIGFIVVHAVANIGASHDGWVCFRVIGDHGHVEMELPDVYEIRGDGKKKGAGHNITASIQPDGKPRVDIPVAKDGSTQVGIGTNPPGPETVLLQLKVTP